jgi:hypothetical protein
MAWSMIMFWCFLAAVAGHWVADRGGTRQKEVWAYSAVYAAIEFAFLVPLWEPF